MGIFNSSLCIKRVRRMNMFVYFRVSSKEDEKKWKEFLKHYFPNCYASEILKRDWYKGHNGGGLQAISVDIDAYGLTSMICVCRARHLFQRVESFEEFKETDVYKYIVSRGPTLEAGEPKVVSASQKEKPQ